MFENLKQKSEVYRRKFALGVASGVFLVMFFSWAFFKGFLGYSAPVVAIQDSSTQVAAVSVTDPNYSPLSNTKTSFSSAWAEISLQFKALEDSISSVLVPFITGIDVYNKTGK